MRVFSKFFSVKYFLAAVTLGLALHFVSKIDIGPAPVFVKGQAVYSSTDHGWVEILCGPLGYPPDEYYKVLRKRESGKDVLYRGADQLTDFRRR